MHEMRDVSGKTRRRVVRGLKTNPGRGHSRSSLLHGLGLRAGDGAAVKEREELSEGVEERPVGEEADALVGVDGAGGGGGGRASAGVRVGKAQLGALALAQALQREGLVELDGSSVHLDRAAPTLAPDRYAQRSDGLTFSPEAPVRTKVEKTGREYLVFGGQRSMVAPMGRQKRGTDSGRGKDS